MPASIFPTRSAPTSAAFVKMPPPRRAKTEISEPPNASPMRSSIADDRAVVEPLGQDPVVAGHAEEPEADDEQARDRPRTERDVQRRLETRLGSLGGPDVGANGDVHPDEAGGRGERGADQEADRRSPAQLVVEAEQEEGDDRDDRDRRVLLLQVRRSALLNRAGDLLHPLAARGAREEPVHEIEAVEDRDPRAQEREQHGMILEEVHLFPFPVTK